MIESILTPLLWFSAITCGLLAGLYFAFSAFITTALGQIDRASGIAAMNAINRVILRSTFMPLFVGSTLASFVLAVIGVARWGERGAAAMLAGGGLYVLGMFVVTMLGNVPLNNALIRAERDQDGDIWSLYLTRWTRWNHIRTLASTLAMALFIYALVER